MVLSENEVHTYANTIRHNEELVTGLYYLFEHASSEEILDPVCHQLFEFYRSSESSLRLFSLDFIPVLIWLYLTSLSGKKACGGVEAFLLGVYNLEIVTTDGKPRVRTFRIPKFAQPSVYHEPSVITASTPTDVALSRLDQSEPDLWQSGPFPQYEVLNGQNRQGVLAFLQQCYNADIANVSPQSHQVFCKTCSKIATSGFVHLAGVASSSRNTAGLQVPDSPPGGGSRSTSGELTPRVNVSPALMIEMLSGLYYVTFNTELALGTKAIFDLHHRASYELYADVLLVTSAMTNTLQSVPVDADDRVKSMTTVTPSSSGHAISKSAITNASFKIKKLPDDISIIQDDENPSKLSTIDEDGNPVDAANPKPASKTSKFNLIKAMQNKGEKSKSRDTSKRDSIEMTARPVGMHHGDNVDGSVQVGVIKNNSRMIVDNVDLQHQGKKHLDHEANLVGEDKMNSSPGGAGKHKSIGEILVSGAKDLKGKLGHHRHPSGSSINSESTNL